MEKAQEARDALVKAVYGNLFQYIIDRINRSLASSATPPSSSSSPPAALATARPKMPRSASSVQS